MTQARGLPSRAFESGELALDIDEPQDLDAWRGYDTQRNVGELRESTPVAGCRDGLPGNRIDVIRAG